MTVSLQPSQWDYIRQNIGIWNGEFEQFSSAGDRVKTTPSVLTLEETEPNETMALTLVRLPANEPQKINELTFTYPGPAPYTYFFESGAFSQGSSQWSSFGLFVTEFSMKIGDRRVRFVVAYESTPSYKSAIKYVTLICETQEGGTQFVSDALLREQLLGTWQGTGDLLDAASGRIKKMAIRSQWQMPKDADESLSLRCSETFGGEAPGKEGVENAVYGLGLAAGGEHSTQSVISLKENEDGLAYQLMLLPKGAYCLLPKEIRRECDFRIEVGWVSETEERSRFIRYYDNRGVWRHSALISDRLS